MWPLGVSLLRWSIGQWSHFTQRAYLFVDIFIEQSELVSLTNLNSHLELWFDSSMSIFFTWLCSLFPQKGAGYHLDLFWVAILMVVCSFMALPWYVAATVISIAHIDSLKMETETSAPGEQPKFLGVRYVTSEDSGSSEHHVHTSTCQS